MAERASVYEGVQIGAESTAGTGVTGSKKLLATKLGPLKPNVPIQTFMGMGMQDVAAATVGREWTEAVVNGVLSYNDIAYLLAGHFLDATPSSGTFTFVPNTLGANTLKTFTVMRGSAVRAESAYYCAFPDVNIRCNLRECSVSGKMIGRARQEGITLTASPTTVAALPVGVKDWEVSIGTTPDGSGAAALTRCLEAEFSSTGKWAPGFFATPAQESYTALVELAGTRKLSFTVEQDSEGAAFMTAMRAVTQKYFKLAMTRSTYQITIDCPCFIVEADPSDQDNLAGIKYDVVPVYDSTFNTTGGALRIVTKGTITAL